MYSLSKYAGGQNGSGWEVSQIYIATRLSMEILQAVGIVVN